MSLFDFNGTKAYIYHHHQTVCCLCLSVMSLGVTEASILVILIFLRRRVQVAIALLREASKYDSEDSKRANNTGKSQKTRCVIVLQNY